MVTSEYFDGVLAAEIIDHGDGTGTRTTYRPDGTVDTVEQLTGLPIPEPEPPGEKVAVVDLASVVAEQVAAATAGAKAADVARAIVRPLETLTGGSTSTATRSALLAIRDELDRLIEG